MPKVSVPQNSCKYSQQFLSTVKKTACLNLKQRFYLSKPVSNLYSVEESGHTTGVLHLVSLPPHLPSLVFFLPVPLPSDPLVPVDLSPLSRLAGPASCPHVFYSADSKSRLPSSPLSMFSPAAGDT